MAKANTGILGRISGSVGNMTFYTRNGQHLVRQKAVNVRQPNTLAQLAVRDNMKFAIAVYTQLKPFLEYSLADRKINQSVHSEFLRRNLNISIVNGGFDFEELDFYSANDEKISVELYLDDIIQNFIKGTIIYPENLDPTSGDILANIQYNSNKGLFKVDFFPEAADTKNFSSSLVEAEPGHQIYLASFFVNPNKKKVSMPDIQYFLMP